MITITKRLGGEVRRPKVLLCYNYQNGIIDEEDIMFVLNRNDQFTEDNSICGNHKCGDYGY
jgi:hypothetical protein